MGAANYTDIYRPDRTEEMLSALYNWGESNRDRLVRSTARRFWDHFAETGDLPQKQASEMELLIEKHGIDVDQWKDFA